MCLRTLYLYLETDTSFNTRHEFVNNPEFRALVLSRQAAHIVSIAHHRSICLIDAIASIGYAVSGV